MIYRRLKMKNTVKTAISALLVLCTVCFLLASCGEEASNVLTADIYAAAENVTSNLDFGDAAIMTDKDENSDFVLMYQYGVEDEATLETIEGYVITSPEANRARTIAIIKFKDGTDASVIEGVQKTITDVYLANLIETTATYNADEALIADKATFKLYDNALVLAAYDADGNAQVFDLIK